MALLVPMTAGGRLRKCDRNLVARMEFTEYSVSERVKGSSLADLDSLRLPFALSVALSALIRLGRIFDFGEKGRRGKKRLQSVQSAHVESVWAALESREGD